MFFVNILHTDEDRGVLDILIRITFKFTARFHPAISNKIPTMVSCPKFFHYFSTLLILNFQIQNYHCASKYLYRITHKSQLIIQ